MINVFTENNNKVDNNNKLNSKQKKGLVSHQKYFKKLKEKYPQNVGKQCSEFMKRMLKKTNTIITEETAQEEFIKYIQETYPGTEEYKIMLQPSEVFIPKLQQEGLEVDQIFFASLKQQYPNDVAAQCYEFLHAHIPHVELETAQAQFIKYIQETYLGNEDYKTMRQLLEGFNSGFSNLVNDKVKKMMPAKLQADKQLFELVKQQYPNSVDYQCYEFLLYKVPLITRENAEALFIFYINTKYPENDEYETIMKQPGVSKPIIARTLFDYFIELYKHNITTKYPEKEYDKEAFSTVIKSKYKVLSFAEEFVASDLKYDKTLFEIIKRLYPQNLLDQCFSFILEKTHSVSLIMAIDIFIGYINNRYPENDEYETIMKQPGVSKPIISKSIFDRMLAGNRYYITTKYPEKEYDKEAFSTIIKNKYKVLSFEEECLASNLYEDQKLFESLKQQYPNDLLEQCHEFIKSKTHNVEFERAQEEFIKYIKKTYPGSTEYEEIIDQSSAVTLVKIFEAEGFQQSEILSKDLKEDQKLFESLKQQYPNDVTAQCYIFICSKIPTLETALERFILYIKNKYPDSLEYKSIIKPPEILSSAIFKQIDTEVLENLKCINSMLYTTLQEAYRTKDLLADQKIFKNLERKYPTNLNKQCYSFILHKITNITLDIAQEEFIKYIQVNYPKNVGFKEIIKVFKPSGIIISQLIEQPKVIISILSKTEQKERKETKLVEDQKYFEELKDYYPNNLKTQCYVFIKYRIRQLKKNCLENLKIEEIAKIRSIVILEDTAQEQFIEYIKNNYPGSEEYKLIIKQPTVIIPKPM